jgi:hypothetical protein
MNSFLETAAVAALALFGFLLGRWFSRLRGHWWLMGYGLPALMIATFIVIRRNSELEFVPPFSWMLAGRTEFALTGFVGALILSTPLSRLGRKQDRIAVMCFIALFVSVASLWPFISPAFNHRLQASLKTTLDSDGVCHQGTQYNCGPAAAVTALRRLGVPAEEGEIAILAHTSYALGTPPDVLGAKLQERFGAQGVEAHYRHFKSVRELRGDGFTLAVIKFGFMSDHYVTVLDVDDQNVTVGDPFRGKMVYSIENFAKEWRFTGIVVRRPNRKSGAVL